MLKKILEAVLGFLNWIFGSKDNGAAAANSVVTSGQSEADAKKKADDAAQKAHNGVGTDPNNMLDA